MTKNTETKPANVPVVEITLTHLPDLNVEHLARFVLLEDGEVRVVELARGGRLTVDEFIINPGITARNGQMLNLEDGRRFLDELPNSVTGPFFLASAVFEMPLDEALEGIDP